MPWFGPAQGGHNNLEVSRGVGETLRQGRQNDIRKGDGGWNFIAHLSHTCRSDTPNQSKSVRLSPHS